MTEAAQIRRIVNKLKRAAERNDNFCRIEDVMSITREPVKYLGEGSYRKVYKFAGLPLVVKVINPDEEASGDCIDHSINEVDAIRTVKTEPKFKKLRKYLPKIYFFDRQTGVIVMHWYPQTGIKHNRKRCKEAAIEITHTLKKKFDLYKNFSVSPEGKVVLIDWGVLGQESDWEQYSVLEDYSGESLD